MQWVCCNHARCHVLNKLTTQSAWNPSKLNMLSKFNYPTWILLVLQRRSSKCVIYSKNSDEGLFCQRFFFNHKWLISLTKKQMQQCYCSVHDRTLFITIFLCIIWQKHNHTFLDMDLCCTIIYIYDIISNSAC